MMFSLHQVVLGHGHVVSQIVESELIVGSESDVAVVGPAAGVAVGLVLVYAVH